MSTAKKAPAGNRSRPARGNAIPGCALTAALAAIGGRWKLFVVYRLADGPRHFAALRRSLPDVSAKVLAEQLRELQADGLVSRERGGPVPAPVHYALTPHGLSVLPVAEAIRRWGAAHQAACATAPLDVGVDARAICGVTSPSPHASPAPSFRAQ
ncbi:MAG: helix-turn-helix transcriptional regulator [Burkholderiales bacterium]|nr:helix-turn-helix transcriptional regulator [Burkholderiales bacterium]